MPRDKDTLEVSYGDKWRVTQGHARVAVLLSPQFDYTPDRIVYLALAGHENGIKLERVELEPPYEEPTVECAFCGKVMPAYSGHPKHVAVVIEASGMASHIPVTTCREHERAVYDAVRDAIESAVSLMKAARQ